MKQMNGKQAMGKLLILWICLYIMIGWTAVPITKATAEASNRVLHDQHEKWDEAPEGQQQSVEILPDDALEIYHQLAKGEFAATEKSYLKPKQKTVYLTFDDGPSALTTEVLDILKEEDVKATFFVLGQLVEKHAETVRRIVDEGHSLGNHSYNHQYKELYPDFSRFWDQLKRTEEVIEQTVGIRPELVRAPGGTYKKFDAYYFYYLEQAGYIVHDWNVDSGDSRRKGVPQREIVANVIQAPLKDEMIVLLHDGAHNRESVNALPEIIAYYKAQGYQFAPLTAEVQPVTFRLASEVKGRKPGLEQHLAILEKIEASEKPGESQWVQFASSDRAALSEEGLELNEYRENYGHEMLTASRVFSKALDTLWGITMQSEQPDKSSHQQKRNSEPLIPLRAYMESKGAKVQWWSEQRTAVVYDRHFIIEYRVSEQQIRIYSPGALVASSFVPEMKIVDGTLFIPMSHAL